jgi:hypothetical protein
MDQQAVLFSNAVRQAVSMQFLISGDTKFQIAII